MKKALSLILSLLLSLPMMAQQWTQNLPLDKAGNGSLTLHDMQKAFNDYWAPFNVKDGKYINANGELVKAQGWKQFKRWEWYWENRVNPVTGEFPSTSAWEELQKFQADHPGSIQSASGNWTSAGPTESPGGYAGLGRINSVAFHPTDNNIIYTGAASGGLWKTTDGGSTWSVLNDNLAVLGVSDICINTGSPNIIYIATGDKDGGSVWSLGGGQARDNNSIGIMKSTDGGATWNTTGLSFATSSQKAVFRLLMDPGNNNTLYAATSSGLYKTTDGGSNWNNIYSAQIFCDLEFKPGTPSTIYGSNKSGDIYRSIDAGTTWTSRLSTTFLRVEMAVSPANANYVYAVMQDNATPDESPVYKSTDGGDNFTRVFTSTTKSLLGYECNGSDVNKTQASYDLTISADPTDANIVFVGGINVWRSTDGGSTWNINTHWSNTCSGTATTVHADQHCLAYQPGSNHLFLGNDGGLYKTTDGGGLWTFIGSGIVSSQVYRIGVSQTVASEVIDGLQDNGTKVLSGGTWADVKGGDGMECIIDYTNANIQYGTYVQGQIDRTSDHWASRTAIEPAAAGSGAWVTPYIIDPTNNQTLYAGYADVWKTTNSGTSWTQISTMNTSNKIRSMAIAASNTQVLYVADPVTMWKTIDGGTSWTNITAGLPVSTNDITYISVKADDPLTVWVAFGEYNASKVYQTTDGGTIWTDISAGLPSIPVMCVIQNKQSTSRVDLYAATDVGVFVKAGTADWQMFMSGLPNVLTTELEIYYDANPGNSKIYAGTYGRGMWVSDLYESGILNPANVAATASSDTRIDIAWSLVSGNNVMLAFSTSPTFGTPVNGTTYTTTIPGGGTVLYNGGNTTFNHTSLNPNTTYYYKIWSYDGSKNYSSGITANKSTFCTLISAFPWIEGFEGGVIPNCWTQEYVNGTNAWSIQASGINGHPSGAHGGTKIVRCNVLVSGAGYITKFVTPALQLSSVASPFLTFWHTQDFWSPNQDELRVYYKTSEEGAWNLLASYTNSIASWTKESISLPNASSAYFIAFESTVNAGYGVCIDDISVSTSLADFTASGNLSCTGSLTVNFTDNSFGPNGSWAWDIDNNGTTDYTTQNPTHTYSSPGLYSVKLSVNNGVADTIKENLILVMSSEPTVNTGCTLASNSNNGNGYGIGIFRFALGNIDYTTSNNDGYYQNYTCSKWTRLELNKLYNITIRTGTSNNEGAKVYIDFNDNGTFEAGEAVVSFPANKDGTRTLSFTTPSSGVVLDKGLRLSVLSRFGSIPSTACDISTYGQAEDYTVYFITDATWTGTASTDWHTPGNWSYNVVPGTGINTLIPTGLSHYPVLTADVTCKNLYIQSGASVTVNPGKALTVNGTLKNYYGYSGLLIKSDATGTGSLIHTTANADGTFERYMNNADWTNSNDGWHFLSSPVSSQPVSPAFTADPYDFYCWYEPQNLWVNFKNTTTAPTWNTANGSTNFTVGKGYLADYDAEGVKLFTGKLNVADEAVSGLAITGGGTNRSWHLLGNPFGSALTWDASGAWALNNISGVAKIWNEANQSYSDLTSSPPSIIPATNGFMVQVNTGTGSLVLPAAKRVHSSVPFYKSATGGLLLKAVSIAEGNAQESRVILNQDATTGFDLMYDGEFLAGHAPGFYSLVNGQKLSTNSIPSINLQTEIPFGFIKNAGNDFRIEVTGVETLNEKAYLQDLMTGTVTDLSLHTFYAFTSSEGDNPDRFLLKFGNVGIPGHEQHYLRAWYSQDKLFLSNTGGEAFVEIYNMAGQQVYQCTACSNPVQLSLGAGIYFARVTSKQQVKTVKFIVGQ
ncbi:MAG: GEVED domain-containing protein [Bacteroidetes bacterium]|nr:GEVED domain-containing protein [Bacteroidota bacterium]